MGIYAHQFYFKKGLPKIDEIKKVFYKITGLKLYYHTYAHLDELMTKPDDILYRLEQQKEETNLLVINRPYFDCRPFYEIYLGDYMKPEAKTFYIECAILIENMYFWEALIKTMLELGGFTYTNHVNSDEETDEFIEQYLDPYNPYERKWKRIKKWGEMSSLEKAMFKNKLVKKNGR